MAKAATIQPTPEDPFSDLRNEKATLDAVATIQAEFASADVDLWDSLTDGAVEIDGYDLIKDKLALVGIPFLVRSVVYRDGNPMTALENGRKVSLPQNYVSLEIMIGGKNQLLDAVTRGRITAEQHNRWKPYEKVVINDGSTGICRQTTAFLVSQGCFVVPDGEPGGAAGTSRFDTYRSGWKDCRVPLFDVEGAPLPAVRFNLGKPDEADVVAPVLVCPRGLRPSDYTRDGANEASTTFYFA